MTFGEEWEKEKKIAFENEGDAEKMLQLYIYNHMKKKNLHDVAEIFAKEANLEISQLVECDESMLTEWWEIFWPTFCSRLSNKAGANAQSSGQSSLGNALAMLASLKITPMVNLQQKENQASILLPPLEMNQQIFGGSNHSGNVIAQFPADLLSTPGINQRRTGKLPMNTVSDSILGRSAGENLLVAQAFGKERLGFPPVDRLFDANNMLYAMPPSCNQSHLQLPATLQSPFHVTTDPKNDGLGRPDRMDPTRPVGPNFVYTAIEHHAGEDNRTSQMPLTGGGVSDGLNPVSSRSHVPFFLLMQQEVQRYRVDTNPPPNRTSRKVQEGSETSEISKDLGSVTVEFLCPGVTERNGPYLAYGSAVPEEKETEGVNNDV